MGLIQAPNRGIAVSQPGYHLSVNPSRVAIAVRVHGNPLVLTDAEFDDVKWLHTNGASADTTRIDGLPARIPLTVQGASEQFIVDKLGAVNVHTTTVANTLNGFNATYRNEIRTHVTAEADRVIASE